MFKYENQETLKMKWWSSDLMTVMALVMLTFSLGSVSLGWELVAGYLNKLMVRRERHLLMCREIEDCCWKSCFKALCSCFLPLPRLRGSASAPHPSFPVTRLKIWYVTLPPTFPPMSVVFLVNKVFIFKFRNRQRRAGPQPFAKLSRLPTSAKDSLSVLILTIGNRFEQIVNVHIPR